MTFARGQRRQLEIVDIAFGGEGVAKIGEFVVFVPFVIAGEIVEAELVEVKKNFGRAKLLEIVRPSPRRVAPPCRYFGDCGGCQYQHMDYAEQLAIKQKQVRDLLERVGGFANPPVDPAAPSPRIYGYRNRIMVRSQWNKPEQRLNIGFIRHDNRLVADVEECVIAEPEINRQLKFARDHPPPRGGLKIPLRVLPEGWDVPKDSFFQNNFFLLPKLVEVVRQNFQRSGSRFLIDLYCGVGFFSLELADLAEQFVGIEWDRLAIAAARQNASRRGRANGRFVQGKAEEQIAKWLREFPPEQTTVLIDPPRTGCAAELLMALRHARPNQALYISCHPATLARDARQLGQDAAFTLARLTPLDMFPQTAHVECAADFRAGRG